MAWAALLLSLTTIGPAALSRVDFDTKAAALGTALQRLSRETGLKLEATPKIAHEIVFVRARGVEPNALKARLAEALDATWIKEGETEYLTRGLAQEKEIWRRHLALRRKNVDEELERVRKEIERPFDARALASGLVALPTRQEVENDPVARRRRYEREKALFAHGPATRLLHRLLLACDPDDLAAVGPYERAVFRPSPTRMQQGIGAQAYRAALRKFEEEQQAWTDAAGGADFRDDPSGRMVTDPRSQIRLKPSGSEEMGLDVIRGEMASLFMVNLVGPGMGGGTEVLSQSTLADSTRQFLDRELTPAPRDLADPIVELSPESQAFQTHVSASFGGARAEPLDERLREWLLNPERWEPLSFAASDVLAAYAEKKNLNVVAALPDSTLAITFFVSQGGPLRLFRVLNAWIQGGSLNRKEEGGWAILTPTDRFESALDFTPRAPVAVLMKSIAAKGLLDVRDYASYAFQTGRVASHGLGEMYLVLYDGSVLSALDNTNWDALRLYGSFDRLQQRRLEAGTRVPFQALTHAQKSIVLRIAYKGPIRSEEQLGDGRARLHGAPIEPTEAFPSGLSAHGTVSAGAKAVPVLVAYGKGSDGKVRPLRHLNVSTLATIEADAVGHPDKMSDFGVTGLVGYAPGSQKLVALRVELAPGVWRESPITVPDYDPDARPVPWEKLPASYVKQIRDAIEQTKAQKANQPARTIPPSPAP